MLFFVGSMAISEVEANVDVDVSKGAISGKLALAVVVSMEDGTHSSIVFHVVPHQAEATDTVNVEVVEREVAEGKTLVFRLTYRTLVAYSDRQRGSKEPIFGKHPIICPSCRDGNIGVIHLPPLNDVLVLHFLDAQPLLHQVNQTHGI